jgi:hypothetical protein
LKDLFGVSREGIEGIEGEEVIVGIGFGIEGEEVIVGIGFGIEELIINNLNILNFIILVNLERHVALCKC